MALRYKLTAAEQETTLIACRDDDEVVAYTSDRLMMRRLDKLCEQFPTVYSTTWTDDQILGDGLPLGKRYMFPRRYLRFGHPASAAQIEAARVNAAKIRSARRE